MDRLKMLPERPVEAIKEEALAKQTGVAVKTYFAPRTARALGQAEEELVSIAVEEWLISKGYLKTVWHNAYEALSDLWDVPRVG